MPIASSPVDLRVKLNDCRGLVLIRVGKEQELNPTGMIRKE
jgi:hypothetical protein